MENKLYLKEVTLSGYKSINDVSIQLQKGLNIIIGKNAAGKTNFLSFLNKTLSLNYDDLNNFSSTLMFRNGKDITLVTERDINVGELFKDNNLSSKINTSLKISNKTIKDTKDKDNSIYEKLIQNNIVFSNSFLCHGIPKEYIIVDKPFSFKIEKDRVSSDLSNIFRDFNSPYFLKCLTIDIVLETFEIGKMSSPNIKKNLSQIFKGIEGLNNILRQYSPIEAIRFGDNYNIFIDKNEKSFSISNLFLEFKVDGNWLPFSNLSDGTKRLFYIISEVYEVDNVINVRPSNSGRFYGVEDISRIILIEEPELGIHPHQFHKLMEFLKLESEKKQIIITTHSPQALDSINQNELNRIIIAYSTNSVDGTKLRHLNENELNKANEYIKEDFLSDYWLYSDLEK